MARCRIRAALTRKDSRVGPELVGLATEHDLESTSQTLASRPGLSGDASAANVDEHIEPIAHVQKRQRTAHRAAVLLFREELVVRAIVDEDLARTFRHAHAGNGALPPTRAQVKLLRCAHIRF